MLQRKPYDPPLDKHAYRTIKAADLPKLAVDFNPDNLPQLRLYGQEPARAVYLRSRNWYDRKARLFSARGRQCEKCGGISDRFFVEHLTWERIGYEEDEDLQIQCEPCYRLLYPVAP